MSSPLSDRPAPSQFKFPWEVRQLMILALMSRKSGGLTFQTDIAAEKTIKELETAIGSNTQWKSGKDIFGDMADGLSEDVVQYFMFMIIGKILKDNRVDSKDIKIALHDKNLIGALEGALGLLKKIN